MKRFRGFVAVSAKYFVRFHDGGTIKRRGMRWQEKRFFSFFLLFSLRAEIHLI
jgi:hypothetical protein